MNSEFTQQKNKNNFSLKQLGLQDFFGICNLQEKKKLIKMDRAANC